MLLPSLSDYLLSRETELGWIDADRRSLLRSLAEHLAERLERPGPPRLIFICTHNSRRSHIAQLFAEAAARRGMLNLTAFSGGTEATAFDPRAAAAVSRAGFRVRASDQEYGAGFQVELSAEEDAIHCFSKIHDAPPNPTKDFAAVMVCDDADRACPHVAGADDRFTLPYRDPKESDGTPRESEVYDERCREIAREMVWLMGEVSRLR